MKTTSTQLLSAAFTGFLKTTLFLLFFCGLSSLANAQLVINQIYAGGGTANAAYNASFVQLLNQSATQTFSLSGLSLQFARGNGSGWQVIVLPGVVLEPGEKFIIAGTGNQTNGNDFDADLDNTSLNLVTSGGVVALRTSTAGLSTCPTTDPTILEFVGWGNATCYYQRPLASTTNDQAFYRKSGTSNTSITGSNFAKFQAAIANPQITTLAVALPINLYSFSGLTIKQGNQLNWKASVTGASVFQVERSENGVNFSAVALLPNNQNGDENYTFIDANAGMRSIYYRIKMKDEAGKESFSSVIKLAGVVLNQDAASLYPTMASSQVTLAVSSTVQQQFAYRIVSSDGRTVTNGKITAAQGVQTHMLAVNGLQKGQYFVQLQSGNGRMQTLPFFKG